jgi:hypothetical protein
MAMSTGMMSAMIMDTTMSLVLGTAMTWTMTVEPGMTMTQTVMVSMKRDDYSLGIANPTGATMPKGRIL